MSAPKSLRAAFESCQPLRRSLSLRGSSIFSRQFHTCRSHLFAEPSLSPSELPSSLDNPESSTPLATNQSISLKDADKVGSSPPAPTSASSKAAKAPATTKESPPIRLPRSVQASYLRPLRMPPTHGLPVCSLQLRSFSVRNLEFMADFAMRAAYYLGLPATGPSPLPRIVQRWTVLKSNFINKKHQENFERITMRRVVEIRDGDAEVVKIWLAYLRRYAFWGVGMKANIWEFEGLDVAQNMDKAYQDIETDLRDKLSSFGWKASIADQRSVPDLLKNQGARLPGSPMMELRRDSQTAAQPFKTEPVY